jgi:hypothetical protein
MNKQHAILNINAFIATTNCSTTCREGENGDNTKRTNANTLKVF